MAMRELLTPGMGSARFDPGIDAERSFSSLK
jgi:hypothetical protein